MAKDEISIDSKGEAKTPEAPQYRGFFSTWISRWYHIKLCRGSQRFLSVPKSERLKFFVALIFVYAADAMTRVELEEADGASKNLKRLYVLTKWPFISRKPVRGSYKCLFFDVGFRRHNTTRTLFIHTKKLGAMHKYPVWQVAPVAKEDLVVDLDTIQSELNDMAEAGARDETRLAILDRSLIEIQGRDKSALRDSALIQLYCTFKVNHDEAYSLFENWRPVDENTDYEQAIGEIRKKLQKITAPLSLGRHGYFPSFANLDIERMEADLSKLMDALRKFNVEPFLNSGTLLGYFRDGGPIPYDDDFDLGILLPGDTEDEIFENWRKFRQELSAEMDVINKGSLLALILPNGVQVDLFAAWINDGDFYVYPYCWADVKADALLPFNTLDVRGRKFAIPANPDAVLSVNYGPNWRVPEPFWRFDYTLSRKRFKYALRELKST